MTLTVYGEVQVLQGLRSTLHLNLLPGSLDLKANPALRMNVFFVGCLVILVSGAVVSATASVKVKAAETGARLAEDLRHWRATERERNVDP